MNTKTQIVLILTAGSMLTLGCATSGSASVDTNSLNPSATSSVGASADEPEDRAYLYAYDYDNDGSYAAAHVWRQADDGKDSLAKRSKYVYRYDRNGNGNHAAKRPLLPRVDVDLELDEFDLAEVIIPLQLDPSLEMACKETKPTFFFGYDSAELPEEAEVDFENVVRCLQHTSLEDADIEVVGHADARGSEEYNRDLGRERAEAVAAELEDAGLEEDRIQVISRGETKADAPNHWDDRRVVIRMR